MKSKVLKNIISIVLAFTLVSGFYGVSNVKAMDES